MTPEPVFEYSDHTSRINQRARTIMFPSYSNDNSPSTSWEFPLLNSSLNMRFIVEGLKNTTSLAASYGVQQLKGAFEQFGQGHLREEEGWSEKLPTGGKRWFKPGG